MFDSWVVKFLWRSKWQPTPVFLPGKSHGQRTLAGYSPQGHKRVGHELATKTITNNNKACGMLQFSRNFSSKTTNSDDMLDEYRVKKILLIILIFYFIVRIFRFVTCYFIKRTYLVILFSFNTDKSVYIVASLCVVKKIFFGLKS